LSALDGDRAAPPPACCAKAFGDLGADERQPFVIHEIAFGKDGDAAPHAEQLDDGEMLLRLRHDAFRRRR